MTQRSVIEYYSEHEGYTCGYCKKPDTNYSHGMWAHTLTVRDYQDLIDRGWRRSGKYCYKPVLDVICCPMYTIRCKALEFKLSKSQKKVLKRINKLFMGQDGMPEETPMSSSNEDIRFEIVGREQYVENRRSHQDINIENVDITFIDESEDLDYPAPETTSAYVPSKDCQKDSDKNDETTSACVPLKDPQKNSVKKDVAGPDITKAPCKKAKQARRERMLEKLKKKGVDVSSLDNSNKNKEKQIEDFINELTDDVKKKLEIKLVRTTPPSPEWIATSKETHELYVKYQTIVHGDRPEKCSESQFNGFLVNSPLVHVENTEDSPPCGYGSFHQQYRFDGKLIAVGVLDILPKCVSSVYFFYDPQHMNLSLGTYGALREIAFTRQLNTVCPNIKYYYMGFYIHSCHKMRYKGNFHPSNLLCPETYQWFPLKDCIPKLEAAPYSRFNPDKLCIDVNMVSDKDIRNIQVLSKGQIMPYKVYRLKYAPEYENIEYVIEYARLVGSKTVKRMIMIRQ